KRKLRAFPFGCFHPVPLPSPGRLLDVSMICHDRLRCSVMSRKKFATQVDADILTAVRAIAQEEGRQIQALVDEALSDLVEKRRKARPRPHVMDRVSGQP